ncbi:MAG: cell division protein SepF [Candidatus Carbobacillus altaicus]|nr:cell division protein SepF [Candidatus Carbobacillus altaicus]
MMEKVLSYLGITDEKEDEASEHMPDLQSGKLSGRRERDEHRIVSLDEARGRTNKVVLMEPGTFNDVKEIADHLRARRSVIVNLHRIRTDHLQRMKDFLSGSVYVLDGEFKRLGEDVYLLAPAQVDVEGVIAIWEEADERHER